MLRLLQKKINHVYNSTNWTGILFAEPEGTFHGIPIDLNVQVASLGSKSLQPLAAFEGAE